MVPAFNCLTVCVFKCEKRKSCNTVDKHSRALIGRKLMWGYKHLLREGHSGYAEVVMFELDFKMSTYL